MDKKRIEFPLEVKRDSEGNIQETEEITLFTESYSTHMGDGKMLDEEWASVGEGIKQKWSKNELEIGGRNYIKNGKGDLGLQFWNPQFPDNLTLQEGFFQYNNGYVYSDKMTLSEGDFNIHFKGGAHGGSSFALQVVDSEDEAVVNKHIGEGINSHVIHFKIPKRGIYRVKIISGSSRVFARWTDMKLEKGDISTAWSPAPEDGIKGAKYNEMATLEHIEFLQKEVKELRELIAQRGL